MKRWTYSSKQKYSPTEKTKTKEEIRLEQTKIMIKRAALEWDDFVFQEQLKSLIYVDRSLCGDPMKDKLIDELKLKNCVRLRKNKTSKLFVGITSKKNKVYYSS